MAARDPHQWDVHEFARQFAEQLRDRHTRFAFFLGAGASFSSGIPLASTLTREWLVRLHEQKRGKPDVAAWAAEKFEGYEPELAARFYSDVMKALFPNEHLRQAEIERIITGRDPGFGYAVLAKLMSHPEHRPYTNVVLTTNFDDLVADAMYLYSNSKPLVISHDSLAGFARTSSMRPQVVKLHGDARLAPRNTPEEIAALEVGVQKAVTGLLRERCVVIIGYGGNDESIHQLFQTLEEHEPHGGLYWVTDAIPDTPIGAWFRNHRHAVWVRHLDFDELMLLIDHELRLEAPDRNRLEKLWKEYDDSVDRLLQRIAARSDAAGGDARTAAAAEDAAAERKSPWAVVMRAQQLEREDIDEARKVYEAGVADFPSHPGLLGSYAVFLKNRVGDLDEADTFYRRAIEANPNHASILGNYAILLADKRGNIDQADAFHKRAIEADPNHAGILGNYALFLKSKRGDLDQADAYYKRAIEADPNHAINLGNYAVFLATKRGDADQAETYYKRALESEPSNAHSLGNYGGFQLAIGILNGMEMLAAAESNSSDVPHRESLLLEIAFYRTANSPETAQRRAALRRCHELIDAGVRSRDFDMSPNIERAVSDGHPNPELLRVLHDVIVNGRDAADLDAFDEWRAAGTDARGD